MQNFIVLGMVPGTSIQLTLTFWLAAFTVVTLLLISPSLVIAYDNARRFFIMRKIARTINHFDLVTI